MSINDESRDLSMPNRITYIEMESPQTYKGKYYNNRSELIEKYQYDKMILYRICAVLIVVTVLLIISYFLGNWIDKMIDDNDSKKGNNKIDQ